MMNKLLILPTIFFTIISYGAPLIGVDEAYNELLKNPNISMKVNGCYQSVAQRQTLANSLGKTLTQKASTADMLKCEYGLNTYQQANCQGLTASEKSSCTVVNLKPVYMSNIQQQHQNSNNQNINKNIY